jgi:cellulose biosynthesis protein BcsQ
MHIVIIDHRPDLRAALLGRTQEALRQVEVRRVEPVAIDGRDIENFEWNLAIGCVIGPGYQDQIDSTVEKVKLAFPLGKIAVVLGRDQYLGSGVHIRKRLGVNIVPEGDIAQLAQFLLDCDEFASGKSQAFKNRGVIGVAQFKGGVGATSLVAAFGSCWAHHGLYVAGIDFDDVNPQLTAWAKGAQSGGVIGPEHLKEGVISPKRLPEILTPIEGFEGKFAVAGQPDSYRTAFHFKATVLDEAPSASDFVHSLIMALKVEYDVVIIDLGRSWGVATFAALPLCHKVLLVTDDDGMSVRRTLDCLMRLKNESEDPDEFDLTKWRVLLNACTGLLITPKELEQEMRELDVFPPSNPPFSISFSERGRQWGAPGQTLYDLAESRVKREIKSVAGALIPFIQEKESGRRGKFLRRTVSI